MKKYLTLFFTLAVFLLAFLFDLNAGSLSISLKKEFLNLFFHYTESTESLVLLNLRLPRVFTSILIGIALPVSGLLLQTLFVNPLAGPYIFGISSGASFGVALVLLGASVLGFAMPTTFSIITAAILGAGAVLIIILFVSLKVSDTLVVLIVGLMLGSAIGAVVRLLEYFSAAPMLKNFVVWSMGSVDGVKKEQLLAFSVLIFVPFILITLFSKFLDSLYLGHDNAQTLGVNVRLLRILIFVVSGVMTGVSTAYCGPVGFVGIVVPHIVRFLFKTHKHLHLILLSGLLGATFMLISDGISHSFGAYTLPINSITAVLGIPIIIWIIFRNRHVR